ncbi:MAG TPA: patatin-like phospholipase family protein [Gemmata sp.]|nr:patatin-like phospholipase family protein [Gemmata sp.]
MRWHHLVAFLLIGLAQTAGCQPASREAPFRPPTPHPNAQNEVPQWVPSGVTLAGPLAPDPGLRPPRHVLALSSGGLYGAYSAGFLSGWTKTGTRPEFDVVTGVSTGALAAPFAFLGPEFDDRLQQLYTGVRAEDVFRIRTWVTIPFKDAVASSAPLQELIDSQINQELMRRLAVEHRKGRRLYIGTTNLDTRRLVIWDMGAIASMPSPDGCRLFRDVIVASCSVPGMLPPVMFNVEIDGLQYTEMHVDGGVSSQIFVPSQVFRAAAKELPVGIPVLPGATGNLYAVVAGKLYPDVNAVKRRVLPILGATTQSLMYAHCRSELMSLYGQAQLAGMQYHLTALRQDVNVNAETLISIDQNEMTKLCLEGGKDGLAGPAWRYAPPDICPGDGDFVRGGLRLRTTGPTGFGR